MNDKIRFIDPNDEPDFNEDWKKLLHVAFEKARTINVVRRLSGYSGAQTWSIRTQTDATSQIFVVKFDEPKFLEREYNKATSDVTGGALFGNPVTPEGEIVRIAGNRWALMKSTLKGMDKSDTLLDHLQIEGAKYIEKILRSVFTRDNRLRTNTQPTLVTYSTYYDRLLPEHFRFDGLRGIDENAYPIEAMRLQPRNIIPIERDILPARCNVQLGNFFLEKVKPNVWTLRPDRPSDNRPPRIRIKYRPASGQTPPTEDEQAIPLLFGQNPQSRLDLLRGYAKDVLGVAKTDKKTFNYRNIKFSNPLYFLPELLEKKDELNINLIHGDLNLRNILIAVYKDEQGNVTDIKDWLIDFADTDMGPVLFDLQWLEVQVILWLLAPAIHKSQLNISVLIDLFLALHECQADHITYLHPSLQTSYMVIRQIRLWAKKYLVDDWSEYYRGMVLALLGSLRLSESVTDFDTYVPRITFLSAAILLSWAAIVPSDDLKSIDAKLQVPPKFVPPPPPAPPYINPSNIPDVILPNQLVQVHGTATPKTTVQVTANQENVATTDVDKSGNWQASFSLQQAGTYHILVKDKSTGAESDPLPIFVKQLPRIDITSIPQQLFAQRKFSLHGTAQPGTTVQLLANQQPLTETSADSTGRWKAEIVLDKPGSIELVIHDKLNKAKSAPISVTVLKPATTAKKILLPLASGVLLFILVGATWFIPPVQSPHWLNSAWGQVCNFVPSLRQYIPFGDTTESIRAGLTRWGKIIVAASIESAPFSYINANGRFDGLDVELVREMVRGWFVLGPNDDPEKMGLLEFKRIWSADREDTLRDDPEIAFLIGAFSYLRDRCVENFICTRRQYFSTQDGLLVRTDSPIEQSEQFKQNCDSNSIKIIVLVKSTVDKDSVDSKDCYSSKRIVSVEERKQAFEKARGDEGLAYQTDKPILDFYLLLDDFNPDQNLRIIPLEDTNQKERYVIGFSKDKGNLEGLVNTSLNELHEGTPLIKNGQTLFQICLRALEKIGPNECHKQGYH